MKTWHFFDLATGIFVGSSFSASRDVPALLVANTPKGYGATSDVEDWQSQRIDLATATLVDYQPPPPDEDHEWIHDDERGNRVRRWVLKQAICEERTRCQVAQTNMDELERKQARAQRELLLSVIDRLERAGIALDPEQQEARTHLGQIDAEVTRVAVESRIRKAPQSRSEGT